jgi:hypothetical protein
LVSENNAIEVEGVQRLVRGKWSNIKSIYLAKISNSDENKWMIKKGPNLMNIDFRDNRKV